MAETTPLLVKAKVELTLRWRHCFFLGPDNRKPNPNVQPAYNRARNPRLCKEKKIDLIHKRSASNQCKGQSRILPSYAHHHGTIFVLILPP